MKRSTIILLVVLGIIVLWAISVQRGLVGMNENVQKVWSDVEVAYQARADKTANLVEIIKGSAEFEKSTLTAVVEARAKATSIQMNVDDLTPEKIAQYEQAQSQLGGALSRLLATVEQYPQLQTTTAFRDFQAQYEGMENRIAVERRNFNDAARAFNTRIKQFPTNLLAGVFGFKEKGYFSADKGSEEKPKIDFSK